MATTRLSIIVTVVGGGQFLHRCLSHLAPQANRPLVEVLVPYDDTVAGIEALKQAFDEVKFVDMGHVPTAAPPRTQAAEHELYDRRSAVGVLQSQGEIVALLQDYVIVSDDWCEQVLAAHELPYAAIGGAVEHGGRGALNWAVFFQDFGRHQPPLSEGPATYLTDVNVSYKRAALEPLRELWQERYKEATVNWALAKRGECLWQRPQIVVAQDRGRLRFGSLVLERYHWGRLFGAVRTREISTRRRLAYTIGAAAIPMFLLFRAARKVFRGRRHLGHFVRGLPYFFPLVSIWCFGELIGNITGHDSHE